MVEVGLNEEFEQTPPEVMRTTLAYINTRYGSIPEYLVQCGFGFQWQERLRSLLMVPFEEK